MAKDLQTNHGESVEGIDSILPIEKPARMESPPHL